VTRASDSRGRLALVLLTTFLAWIGGSGSRSDQARVVSPATHAAAIESTEGLLLPISGRPVLTSKLGEGQRGLWATAPIRPAVKPAVSELGGVHTSPSVISGGSVAQSLLARGPPSFGES
jgi:hypothetical protein